MINLTVFGSAGNIEVVDEKHQKRIRKRRKIEQDSNFALIDLKIVIHKEQFIENMVMTLTNHQESAKNRRKSNKGERLQREEMMRERCHTAEEPDYRM